MHLVGPPKDPYPRFFVPPPLEICFPSPPLPDWLIFQDPSPASTLTLHSRIPGRKRLKFIAWLDHSSEKESLRSTKEKVCTYVANLIVRIRDSSDLRKSTKNCLTFLYLSLAGLKPEP